ncbi:MAG: hypothetical protein M3Y54_03835, partial [Bacteroidota bacterium]|nr:hypothetical protein [Bacteroidota bacterium]
QFNDGSALQDDLLGAEGGVYSTFFRTYDPATGRFTGVDPLADDYADQSDYEFGNNDPIGFNDPTGALSEGIFMGGRLMNPRGTDGVRVWAGSDLDYFMYESGEGGGGGDGPNAQQMQTYKDAASIGLNPHYSASGGVNIPLLFVLNFYTDKGELNSSVWYPWTFHVTGYNYVYVLPKNRAGDSYQSDAGFDIPKTVAALNQNADKLTATLIALGKEPYGIGKCAAYVRQAFEAGGINTNPHPRSAKDYGSFLIGWGFHVVSSSIQAGGYSAMRGDVAVFRGYGTNHSGAWNGHIEMYNGNRWVSDFKQNFFTPGPGYRAPPVPYTIYRW